MTLIDLGFALCAGFLLVLCVSVLVIALAVYADARTPPVPTLAERTDPVYADVAAQVRRDFEAGVPSLAEYRDRRRDRVGAA